MTNTTHHRRTAGRTRLRRRQLLMLALFALTLPLLRFIGFKVPRKPRIVELSSAPPLNGVVTHADFILFDREAKTWAVSRKCTHLGCRITYHEIGNYLECPCHQSRFTPEGTVIRGPAKANLPIYPVEKRDVAPYYVVTI